MNLWERLQERGREEHQLDDSFHLYAVDLDRDNDLAELKFAPKKGKRYMLESEYVGYVKYKDLCD